VVLSMACCYGSEPALLCPPSSVGRVPSAILWLLAGVAPEAVLRGVGGRQSLLRKWSDWVPKAVVPTRSL
jgi:hypothetical protein